MRKSLITWIFLIICALVLYLFANGSVTLAFLAALIAALPVSYALFRRSARQTELELKESGDPEDRMTFGLVMKNKGILPVALIETDVVCENLRTGERESFTVSRSLGPRKTKTAELEIVPEHAGRYSLTAGPATVRGMLSP